MANGTTNFHERLLEVLPTDPPRARGGVMHRERLQQLALIVQRDLPQIRITFSEFTPHDWNMHILPLFDVAERIFGGDTLLALNNLDKFLLAVGLYGHDWGMAVGQEERTEIELDQPEGTKIPITSYASGTLEFALDLLRSARGWSLYLRKPGRNSRNICFCHALPGVNAGRAIFFDRPEAVVTLFRTGPKEHPVWGDLRPQWADFLRRALITEKDLPVDLGDESNWHWFAESVGNQPSFH